MTQMNINISVNIVHKANNAFVTFQQKKIKFPVLYLHLKFLRYNDIRKLPNNVISLLIKAKEEKYERH